MNAKRVLVIDDDEDTRLLLTMLLGRRGYDVPTCNTGEDALRWLEAHVPDLVILDIMMPGMDGWATYDCIRSRYHVPVVFLTALSAGENAAHALEMGGADYVRKPFHNDELLARVEGLIGKPLRVQRPPAVTWGRLINQRPSVSVVLPTLNEARNLPLVLPYIPANWVDEVILVDGLSTDGTVEVARELMPAIKVILEKTRGKGIALQAGYKAASGDIIIVLDCDGSHDPREIPRFVTALMQGADIVKGSRFAPGGGTTDMPRYRQMGNACFVLLVNLLFRATFTDFCYGYHAFWRYCLNSIDFPYAKGFEIDAALYLGALRDQFRITEVPSFEGYRFFGVGKLQTFPDGWRVLRTILGRWIDFVRTPKRIAPYPGFRGNHPDQTAMASLDCWQSAAPAELIYDLSRQLAGQHDLPARMTYLLQNVMALLQANSGTFLVLDEKGTMAHGILARSNEIYPLSYQQSVEILHGGLAGWVVESGQAALVPSTRGDSRWLQRQEDRIRSNRSAISVPLTLYDRVLGVLTVVQQQPLQFSRRDFALLSAIAGGLSLSSAGLFVPPLYEAAPSAPVRVAD